MAEFFKLPFTEDFLKLKAKYARLYSDSAKANELAYKEAFEKGIITFRDKQFNFKLNTHVSGRVE